MNQNAKRTTIRLFIVTIAMFGFGYAMVPFYSVICKYTGLNGKTGALTSEQAGHLAVDNNRKITVQFDTNVNTDLPWAFSVETPAAQVHPGNLNDAVFVVENKSNQTIVGQAVPSVAPNPASLYFKKTECFCFTHQTLAPGERREMRVRYVIEPNIPPEISTLTLSYTFFRATDTKQSVGQAPKQNAEDKPKI